MGVSGVLSFCVRFFFLKILFFPSKKKELPDKKSAKKGIDYKFLSDDPAKLFEQFFLGDLTFLDKMGQQFFIINLIYCRRNGVKLYLIARGEIL